MQSSEHSSLSTALVVNGFSRQFVCKMGMGPRTNLYNIGGDPLFNYIYFYFFVFIRNAHSDKINGKYVVGDPLTQLKLIK